MNPARTAGLCEDDAELRDVVKKALQGAGFTVRPTSSGSQAVRAFRDEPPDVLVLDIGLPDADGRDVCQALRACGVDAPVLFLTAKGGLTDRLSGFHAGGDDYLSKPFAVAELLVRIDALLRRRDAPGRPSSTGVELDPVRHAVRFDGREAALTPTEYRILAALAARPGEVVRRSALVAAGWPHGAMVHENTLDAYLARLRRKLDDVGASTVLHTARGVGYRLQ